MNSINLRNNSEREQMSEKIVYYAIGLCAMSACVDNDVSVEELVEKANIDHPTGISSKWQLVNKTFSTGETNPCACHDNPTTRKHYTLSC